VISGEPCQPIADNMQFLNFRTKSCEIALVGRVHTDRARPALLIISGSFAPSGFMHEYVDAFRGASVLVAELPGMRSGWMSPTVAQVRESFDELIDELLPGRPAVVCGLSTGCLVSLGLKAPTILRHAAVEPFLSTETLWPFIKDALQRLANEPDRSSLAEYLWTFFGIKPDRLENRDYLHLLRDLQIRTEVLVGELALLPERPTPQWPSFTSEEERRYWRNHPLATLHVGPAGSGHGVAMSEAADFLKRLIHRLLHEVIQESARSGA
jgi:hypothetical protein